MVRPALSELGTELEIEILGDRRRATVIAESPRDRENIRLRAWSRGSEQVVEPALIRTDSGISAGRTVASTPKTVASRTVSLVAESRSLWIIAATMKTARESKQSAAMNGNKVREKQAGICDGEIFCA
ncbi:MAG: hypothetical protein GY791_15575 [Alphaproteobacteria bacterium]|nr:hypothetical protein [Alphaproteobacteria bacterium]